jgi:hypothetical protein
MDGYHPVGLPMTGNAMKSLQSAVQKIEPIGSTVEERVAWLTSKVQYLEIVCEENNAALRALHEFVKEIAVRMYALRPEEIDPRFRPPSQEGVISTLGSDMDAALKGRSEPYKMSGGKRINAVRPEMS